MASTNNANLASDSGAVLTEMRREKFTSLDFARLCYINRLRLAFYAC
jgi:hypothetical protein